MNCAILDEELPNQLDPARSGGFAHAHFFGPFHGPRGGEVDVVHPGDDEDEQSDNYKKVDGFVACGCHVTVGAA